MTDPIRRPAGFEIYRVEEHYAAGQASLDEVQNEISSKLTEPRVGPKVREYLTQLRTNAFLQIKPGFTDSGAAPGKDTTWQDPAQLRPETTTKENVAAHGHKKLLHVIPYGHVGKAKDDEPRPAAGGHACAPDARTRDAAMKSLFVRELKPDEISTAVFLVSTKEVRQKRTGEPYLSLVLSDRTGEIDSKMWDNVAEIVETFDRDDFVKVKGLMQLYNNRPQFTIHKLRRVEEHEVDFRDFFPASLQDPGGDVDRTPRDRLGRRQRPHSRVAERVSGRPRYRRALSGRAGRQDDSSRIPQRSAGTRALAAEAGEAGGRPLRRCNGRSMSTC